MKIADINKYSWIKNWGGNWSFLTCFYFANYYTGEMWKQMGKGIKKAVIISNNGYGFCYFDPSDRELYGKYIGLKIGKNKAAALKFSNELKNQADTLIEYTHKLRKMKTVSSVEYYDFLRKFLAYSGPHMSIRPTVDYLPEKQVRLVLPIFEKTRLYVEDVYFATEVFMRHWAEQLSERMRVNPKFILSCTPSEIKNYWLHQKLPPTKILKARFVSSGIIFDRLENKVFVGRTVERIEKLLQGRPDKKEIKGQTAYGGLVKGNARIIFNPTVHSARVFQKGDILITGMTRPEFLPLMRKAGAVVTDAGGILSHAAITAREMKIPTVIGTTVATKIFKDGDMVEVDATHGVVRILKSQ